MSTEEHYSIEENKKTATIVAAVFYGAGFTLTLATLFWIFFRG